MLWIFFALLFTVLNATFTAANKHFQLSGFRLNFWRCSVATAWLFPVVLMVEWPTNPLFYLVAMLAGASMSICSATVMNLAAQQNGRVAALFQPIQVLVAFFIWIAVDHVQLRGYLENPWQFVMILACLGIFSSALFTIRKNDIGKQALIIVAPIGLLNAIIDTFGKLTLPADLALSQSLLFLFVVYAVSALCAACFLTTRNRLDPDAPLLDEKMLKAALIMGAIGICAYTCFLMALVRSPNPAFVVALSMLTPVLIYGYHRYRKIPDDANVWSGMTLVGAAILLIVVTA